jgi:hypothetical protein
MFEKKVLEKIHEIKGILDLNFKDMLSFEWLYSNWNEDETKMIGDVKITSAIRRNNHLRFITEMPPGSSLRKHWHNCQERVLVLSGQLTDEEIPGKVWKEDDVYQIPAYAKHSPKNSLPHKTTVLQVDFYR